MGGADQRRDAGCKLIRAVLHRSGMYYAHSVDALLGTVSGIDLSHDGEPLDGFVDWLHAHGIASARNRAWEWVLSDRAKEAEHGDGLDWCVATIDAYVRR